jgi:hypothetical protein
MNEQAGQEAGKIHWHLDPTVWVRARCGNYSAEILWAEPPERLHWCIFPPGDENAVLYQVARGTGTDAADARAQAEYVLRKLATAKLTPAQLFALTRLADPVWTTEDTLFAFNGVRVTTAQALCRMGLVRFREGSRGHNWGILLRTREQDTEQEQEAGNG